MREAKPNPYGITHVHEVTDMIGGETIEDSLITRGIPYNKTAVPVATPVGFAVIITYDSKTLQQPVSVLVLQWQGIDNWAETSYTMIGKDQPEALGMDWVDIIDKVRTL